MLDIVADLHLHSRYSRAVSPQMILPVMAQVGRQKGLDLLATGDWTHPIWLREIKKQLEEAEEGIYKIKSQITNSKSQINYNIQSLQNQKDPSPPDGGSLRMTTEQETRFLLSVEISNIYSQNGKGRRIHNLVFVPSFETAEKVNKELLKRGSNLSSDGRPIIGLSSKNLLQLILEIDERSLLIPAHVWTPWFGIYGQMSGFNSLEEAFGDLAPYVYGIETGLSSDPAMNWQIKELNTRSILSFSDAHSLAKMGREATVFRLENLSYENIRKAIMAPSSKNQELRIKDDGESKVLYTIEFYPEEGKYHYSGHRKCGSTMTPEEQRANNSICPVCKRKVTDGVMRRVQELSDEELGIKNNELRVTTQQNKDDIVWLIDPKKKHPPFVKIVPLVEIIAEAIKSPVVSPKAKVIFDKLCADLESELNVLLKADIEEIKKSALKVTSPQNAKQVAEGVDKVRKENIVIKPGYDGLYGIVKIWQEGKDVAKDTDDPENDTKKQIGLDF